MLKLANSSIAIGGVTLNLGDTDATPAFDLSDATSYPFTSLTGITTVISGDTTPTLGGNLNLIVKQLMAPNYVNITGIIDASSFADDGSGSNGVASTITSLLEFILRLITWLKYRTGITLDATSGIVTETGVNVIGIVTATSFVGDGSQLTNIISGVGIQSASTRIGTGFTDINFTGTGITVVGSGTTVTVDIPSSTITRQSETSSGVTTDFTVTGGYTVGLLDVFVNGVKQINGSDFTATDGSTVTMTPNVTDGDIVEFQKYDKLNIAGITSVTNATNAYNVIGGVSFNVCR